MGSNSSSALRLPLITKEHWHQIPLPPTIRRKSSHGQYKLFKNVLTNERIQEYALTFQGEEDYDQYLQSFAKRLQEESIVNTRYFQYLREESFCGSRVFAKIYLEHTPYRLSSIHDIPLAESLYVLTAALAGFQRLHEQVGCFHPTEDMIGIDCEGRIKVWLNPNFSRHHIFGPQLLEDTPRRSQAKMVMEVVTIIDQNTAYQQQQVPRLLTYMQEFKEAITFEQAQKKLEEYSKKYQLAIPKYFVSMLRLLEESNMSDYESHSETNDPFRSQQSRKSSASHIVHYISPALLTNSQIPGQKQLASKEELKSLTCIEQEALEPRQDDANKATRTKGNFNNSLIINSSQRTLPRVNFNYSSRAILMQPPSIPAPPAQPPKLPLSRIPENSSLERLKLTRLVTYSDINEDYQLDKELAEDMVRLFI